MSSLVSWVGWNIFLAAIPLGAAYLFSWLYAYNASNQKKVVIILKPFLLIAVFFIWLAFLPNTCYLITEWRHLLDTIIFSGISPTKSSADRELLVWFAMQMTFYIAFSGIGMLLFVLSTRPMWRIVKQITARPVWAAIPFFFMNALGVYLGLILRLNSWDILHHPSVIFYEVFRVFKTAHLMGLVAGFAILLWLIYLFFDIWIDGFNRRMRKEEAIFHE